MSLRQGSRPFTCCCCCCLVKSLQWDHVLEVCKLGSLWSPMALLPSLSPALLVQPFKVVIVGCVLPGQALGKGFSGGVDSSTDLLAATLLGGR